MVDTRYAAISVSDAKVLDFPEGTEFAVSAVVQNIFSEKRGYQVGVEFRGVSDGNQDEVFIWRSPEEIFLEGEQDQALGFLVPKPTWLSGKYRLTLGMNDRHGNTVALMSLGEKEFSHQGRVELKNCSLVGAQPDGPIQLNTSSGVLGTCGVVWNGAQDELVRLVTQVTSTRYGAPKVLGQSDTIARTDSFVAGDVVVSEMTEPGVYYLEIVPTAAGGHAIGVPFMTTIVVPGSGGKLLGVTRYDGQQFRSGEKVPVMAQVGLYDSSEYELLLKLVSDGVPCADSIRATLQGVSTHEAEFVLRTDCVAPKVTAILFLEEKQIDQWITSDDTPMTKEQGGKQGFAKASPWVIFGGMTVLVLVAGYLIKRRNRTRRMIMPMLFFLFATSLFFGLETKQAEAAWESFYLNCNGSLYSCGSASTLFINVGTNKNTYAPNEPIDIGIVISSDDAPYAPTSPVVRINGGSDLVPSSYNRTQLTAGVNIEAYGVVTAPATAGAFTITVSVASSGYVSPAARQINLTVATVTPTASLTVSPSGPVPEGTTINYTLSSTNAQSCEVERDPGNVIELPRSANTTSMSVSGPTGAGSWVFTTRCWSGTNGSGSVSSTDTDTLVITAGATGSFTSTPSCTIAANGAGCNTTLGWTSSGAATVVLTNCADASIASRGTGSQSAGGVYVPYNSGCYRIHSGAANGPVLDQVTVSSSCAGGTSWSGASCQAVAAVNGTCGSAHGQTYDVNNSIIPNGNRCSTGTYDVSRWGSDAGAWYSNTPFDGNGVAGSVGGQLEYYMGRTWTCDGSGGGITRGCRLYYQPQCGSADGTGPLNSPPPSGNYFEKEALCEIGTMYSMTTTPAAYTWECRSGAGPTDYCSASRPIVGTPPNATITATGPVAMESQKWWQKALSWITGDNQIVHASGANANITTSQNARIDWNVTNLNGGSCTVLGPTVNSTSPNSNRTLSGGTLGVGIHTYTIQCNNLNGSDTDSVQVIVSSSAPSGCCGGGGPGDDVPSGLTAPPSSCGTGSLSISWSPVSGATSYQLRDNGIQIYSGPSTSYTHTGLGAGSSHSYTVRATGGSGSSGYSSPVNQTAPPNCVAVCGNNILEGGEQCDTGGSRGVCPATCSNGCTNNVCSGSVNGVCGPAHLGAYASVPPAGSRCSAGNSSAVNNNGNFWQWNCEGSGGGSTVACWATVIPSGGVCGDGNVDASEQCDAGGANGSCPSSCSNSCTWNSCGGPPPVCGFNAYDCFSGSSVGAFDAGAFWSWRCSAVGHPDAVCSAPKTATGTILEVDSCTIPLNQSMCTGYVSWSTLSATTPRLEVTGGSPADVYSASQSDRPFSLSYGSHAVTLRDVATMAVLDTDMLNATCASGAAWNAVSSQCESAPTVSLTVNGSTGPVSAAPGDALSVVWTVSGATGCTASGKWSGSKSATGGTENVVAAVPSGDYILDCTNAAGMTTTRQVTVNLACVASVTPWSACGPPCAGGDGTRSRTVTTAACGITTETESCTTATCRDLNWKEVGQ